MPAAVASCLASALTTCTSAQLIIVDQGVDVVRTDTLRVLPAGAGCQVAVSEELKVMPRPATTTTFTCASAAPTAGALALSGCSDSTTHLFPARTG